MAVKKATVPAPARRRVNAPETPAQAQARLDDAARARQRAEQTRAEQTTPPGDYAPAGPGDYPPAGPGDYPPAGPGEHPAVVGAGDYRTDYERGDSAGYAEEGGYDDDAASFAVGDYVLHPASGRRGMVIEATDRHGDGTERVAVDEHGDHHPCTAYSVAWFGEVSDPIDPADLEALEA